jgi:hypothetical protein
MVAQQYCQEKIVAIHFYKIQGHQENIKELGRTFLTRKNRGPCVNSKQSSDFPEKALPQGEVGTRLPLLSAIR